MNVNPITLNPDTAEINSVPGVKTFKGQKNKSSDITTDQFISRQRFLQRPERINQPTLLDSLLKLLHDLLYNTKNPDQETIAKILKMIQNIVTGFRGYKSALG